MNLKWLNKLKERLGLYDWEEPETHGETAPYRAETYQVTATARLSIMISRPGAFQDAAEIADRLREKNTLILNIEGLAADVSRRILDFLSGVIYAMDGRMSRVSSGTYLLSPSGLELEFGDWAGLELEADEYKAETL